MDGIDSTSPEGPGAGLGDLTGRQIGRYQILQRLGSGGAATVYRAYDTVQGQTVALKVILPWADANTYNRFRREAQTAGTLRHPHIVRIVQVGAMPQGEVAYIAMELVEGQSLADLLADRGALSPGEASALLAPVAEALAFAHAAGIVHRDVKPSNILLRPAQRGDENSVQLESPEYPVTPLLTDFGIARSLDAPELTSAGRTVGTPAYMAPEQASGSRDVDGRADLYALGTVLYRALAGHLPYAGSATQILHSHVYSPLKISTDLLASLPPELVTVLQRSLAKNPRDRYASASDMAADLRKVAAQEAARHVTRPPSDKTMTMALPAVVTSDLTPRGGGTSVLVPGATEGGIPGRPGAGGSGAGGPPPTVATETTGSSRWGGPWSWITAIALLVLAVGIIWAVVTFLERGSVGNAPLTPIATLALPPSATPRPTSTVTASPAPPTPTLPPTQAPTATSVLVGAPPPTFAPLPPTETPSPTATATETASATPSLTATPTLTATATPTLTMTPTATMTATATVPLESPTVSPPPSETAGATPTLEPSPTLPVEASPTPAPPSETPTSPPTELPPTETPTTEVTPLPDGTPTLEPAEIFTCPIEVDGVFQPYIGDMDATLQPGFVCASSPSVRAQGRLLSFQSGYMLQVDDRNEVYVQLVDGTWQRLSSGWNEGDPEPPPRVEQPPDGLYAPSGFLASIWRLPGVQEDLGFALAPDANTLQVVEQQFAGGVLLADLDTPTVHALLAGMQRP